MSRFVTIAFLVVLGASAAASALGAPHSISCTNSTTTWDNNVRYAENEKIWIVVPDRFRFEQTSASQNRITILSGSDLWKYLPDKHIWMHRKVSAEELAPLKRTIRSGVDTLAEFKQLGARRSGQQKIGGQTCDIYKHTAANGLTTTLYILPGPQHLVRRREENGVIQGAAAFGAPMRTHILKRITDYSDWRVDSSIPDSIFRPPAGVKIQEGTAAPFPKMIPQPSVPKHK